MKKIAFFDTKKYDIESFDRNNKNYEIIYYEDKLNKKTAILANGADAVCAFVNDEINKEVIDLLYSYGIKDVQGIIMLILSMLIINYIFYVFLHIHQVQLLNMQWHYYYAWIVRYIKHI